MILRCVFFHTGRVDCVKSKLYMPQVLIYVISNVFLITNWKFMTSN